MSTYLSKPKNRKSCRAHNARLRKVRRVNVNFPWYNKCMDTRAFDEMSYKEMHEQDVEWHLYFTNLVKMLEGTDDDTDSKKKEKYQYYCDRLSEIKLDLEDYEKWQKKVKKSKF